MPDQNQGGRALGLLTVIFIVLLNALTVLSSIAIQEHYRSQAPAAAAAPAAVPEAVERISMEKQYEVAIHESGHAVLGQLMMPDRPILRIWLYTERPEKSDYLGMTEPGDSAVSYPPGILERSTVLFFLGGEASEQMLLGSQPPDRYEDKDVANDTMLAYCEKVGCECPDSSKVGGQCLLSDMMRVERDRLYLEAIRCLGTNKETVVVLANQLFRKEDAAVTSSNPLVAGVGRRRSLEAGELKAFFEAHPLAPCPK